MIRKPMNRKEALIRMHAARRGLRILNILPRAKCSRSVLYRVIKGTAKSARVDAILARTLGIKLVEMRRANNA